MEDFFDNELAKKFEEMTENNEQYYFDTEELEDIIIYYLELGDISYAELAVNYGLQLHPYSNEIKIKQLEVFIEQENYLRAKELIAELKPSSMEVTDFLVCTAKYYSNLGNPRKAIEYCEKALTLEEEENFLHNFIADEWVNLGEPFSALKHYQLALKHDPQDEYALENCIQCFYDLQKNDELLEFLNRYLDDFPFSEAAWSELGQFYISRKNYTEAIKAFDYLLAINSNAVGVYALKASCLESLKKWEEAIAVYEEVLPLEHTKSYTYFKIGICYNEMKLLVPALTSFQKSLIEDPQFYQSMMEQSFIYEQMGGMKEALHFANEASLLNPDDMEYQKRLAYLYISTGKFEESAACLQKVVAKQPERFYHYYAYSEVLMLIGDFEEAAQLLEEGKEIHERAELFYQLSNCYFHLKKKKDGINALKKAMELDSSLLEDMQQKYPFITEEINKVKARKK